MIKKISLFFLLLIPFSVNALDKVKLDKLVKNNLIEINATATDNYDGDLSDKIKYKIDYLLRYVSNDTYKKICDKKSSYILKLAEDNYIDIDLNIKYLIKYGIKNIDKVVYESLEDLTINHNEYINKINILHKYEIIQIPSP